MLALKTEEEAMGQGMLEKTVKILSPRNFRRNTFCQYLDFSPRRPILDF